LAQAFLARATFWLRAPADIRQDAIVVCCLPLPNHELRTAVADAAVCCGRVRHRSAHTIAGGTRRACNKLLAKTTRKTCRHGGENSAHAEAKGRHKVL